MTFDDFLKEHISYDPLTGIFTWKKLPKYSKKKIGDTIGILTTQGYLFVYVKGQTVLLHRLAFLLMNGSFPSEVVDHIDQNKLNNKFNNLRLASYSQNACNSKTRKSETNIRNVYFNKKLNKFEVKIKHKYKSYFFGLFDSAKEAEQVAIKERKRLHGEYFAQPNRESL